MWITGTLGTTGITVTFVTFGNHCTCLILVDCFVSFMPFKSWLGCDWKNLFFDEKHGVIMSVCSKIIMVLKKLIGEWQKNFQSNI